MSDNLASRQLGALPLRRAAVQRALGLTAIASQSDEEGRPVPAKVYPAGGDGQGWVVEPPSPGDFPASDAPKTFTGSGALPLALEYAHRTYGGALYLSRQRKLGAPLPA